MQVHISRQRLIVAALHDVDLENKVLHCQYPKAVEGTGREHNFSLPYDVLVVGVGPSSLAQLLAFA